MSDKTPETEKPDEELPEEQSAPGTPHTDSDITGEEPEAPESAPGPDADKAEESEAAAEEKATNSGEDEATTSEEALEAEHGGPETEEEPGSTEPQLEPDSSPEGKEQQDEKADVSLDGGDSAVEPGEPQEESEEEPEPELNEEGTPPAHLTFNDDDIPLPSPGGIPNDVDHAVAILTNLLFATNQPLREPRLATLIGGVTPECLRALLATVRVRVLAMGLDLRHVAGGWQLATNPDCAEWIWKLSRPRQKLGLSPQAVETLAIVAYKQPCTKSEVDVIRGMESGNLLRHLVEIELLEITGRKNVPGRPLLYASTPYFLKSFGLASINDLPSVAELKKLFSEREKKRLETEAEKAKLARQQEHEKALRDLEKWHPPVTEMARPLSTVERDIMERGEWSADAWTGGGADTDSDEEDEEFEEIGDEESLEDDDDEFEGDDLEDEDLEDDSDNPDEEDQDDDDGYPEDDDELEEDFEDEEDEDIEEDEEDRD